MPDISMCGALACPLSSECYRHADSGTKPNEPWQTYSAFAYGLNGCPDFWSAANRRGLVGAHRPKPAEAAIAAEPVNPLPKGTV